MNLIRKIKCELNFWGVPKEQRVDVYFKNIIASKTNFNPKDIELLIAKKLDKGYFNYFEFIHKKKKYKLLNGVLKEVA